jgi:ribonuclease HII
VTLWVGGVDETGLGALAGPAYVVGLVIPAPSLEIRALHKKWWPIREVCDSKKTTAAAREKLFPRILDWLEEEGGYFCCGISCADDFNEHGHALALQMALDEVGIELAGRYADERPNLVILDGKNEINHWAVPRKIQVSIPKADRDFFPVAAASIIAKTLRDRYMMDLAEMYPEYGFDVHMGYGVPHHIAMIRKHGIISEHRRKATGTATSNFRTKEIEERAKARVSRSRKHQ